MEHKDLEQLKELLPESEGLEVYYEACVTVLRVTFTRVSEVVKDIKLPEILPEPPSQPPEADPKGTWYPAFGRTRPPGWVHPAPWLRGGAGFQLVDVVRLGQFALIGFQWQETGDQTYVYTVNLREFADHADQGWAVGLVKTIVLTNLLERVRPHWHLHHQMPTIHGLTFME